MTNLTDVFEENADANLNNADANKKMPMKIKRPTVKNADKD